MISRLKKYFGSLLIIDKSLDLLLLFVGLFAAIQVDSYIKQKKTEEAYKNSLTKIFTEISVNKITLKDYSNSLDGSENVIWNLDSLGKLGFNNTYEGIRNISSLEVMDLRDNTFKVLDEKNFLNKNLLRDIRVLYNYYNYIEDDWNEIYENLKTNYRGYFNIFGTQQLLHLTTDEYAEEVVNKFVENIADFYSFGTSVLKKDFWPRLQIKAANTYTDNILSSIEKELELYNVSLNDYMSYDDYYWLSWYMLQDSDNINSLENAKKGLNILNEVYMDEALYDFEFRSFSGRLNRNAVFAIKAIVLKNELKYKRKDTLPYLKGWYDSEIYKEACIVEYLSFYYDTKDFENFYKYTKQIFELESQEYYRGYVSNWSDFMMRDSIISILENTEWGLERWKKSIFPKQM